MSNRVLSGRMAVSVCQHFRQLKSTLVLGIRNPSSTWISVNNMASLSSQTRKYGTVPQTMRVWNTMEYGDPEVLQLDESRVPPIASPQDVLVKVHATSVNPIDWKMLGGYARDTWKAMQVIQNKSSLKSEFPRMFGKDFSGEVVAVGKGVSQNKVKPGDLVWGVINPLGAIGTHAEYTLTDASMLAPKPETLDYIEAAGLPFASMTAWAAFATSGGLNAGNTKGKRVLVVGSSGGLGTFTIQVLSAWGAEITAICSAGGFDLVKSLGADVALDYNSPSFKDDLKQLKGFDVILDYVPADQYEWTTDLLKEGSGAKYVTLNLPFIRNQQAYGLPIGMLKSAVDMSMKAVPRLPSGKLYRWAVMAPNIKVLETITDLSQKGQFRAAVEKVLPFSQTPAAYEQVKSGGNRGKVVIDILGEEKK